MATVIENKKNGTAQRQDGREFVKQYRLHTVVRFEIIIIENNFIG